MQREFPEVTQADDFSLQAPGGANLPPASRLSRLFSFHTALAASLALLVALFCQRTVADPDIWWHLENARRFVSSWHWATIDQFSFTAAGAPWINHEWLAELPFYFAWRLFGLQGIFAVTLLLAEAVVLGAFYLAYRESENIKGAFVYGCLAVLLAVVNFGPRTILVGWCCLMLLLRIVQRIRQGESGPWWTLPLLFAVWVNTHGSWLIGLIVMAMLTLPGFFQTECELWDSEAWNRRERRELMAAWGLTLPALFLNPYGWRLVLYPFDLAMKQKLNVSHVEEWASVDFHSARGKVALLMLAVAFAAFVFSRLRPRLDELLTTSFALYCGLTHIRFLLLASVLLAPVVVRRMTFMPPYEPELEKPRFNAAIVAAIALAIVLRFPSAGELRREMAETYPDKAIAYLQLHSRDAETRLFHEYVWGGYMTWSAPGLKTFVDSRADIFERNGSLADYLEIVSCRRSLELLDRNHIGYVLVRPESPLAYLLLHTAGWREVYGDAQGTLLERVGNGAAK